MTSEKPIRYFTIKLKTVWVDGTRVTRYVVRDVVETKRQAFAEILKTPKKLRAGVMQGGMSHMAPGDFVMQLLLFRGATKC